MRILLLGANGQVGWELRRALAPLGELTALTRTGAGEWDGGLSNPAGTALGLKLEAIVNAVTYTAVDKTESEPELAGTVNAAAPDGVSQLGWRPDLLVPQYYTHCIFDHRAKIPWREGGDSAPLNECGETKACGERRIRRDGGRPQICCSNPVYSNPGASFARITVRHAQQRGSLQFMKEQGQRPFAPSDCAPSPALTAPSNS